MGQTSKDLLGLEQKNPSSSLESTLFVCQKESASQAKKPNPDGKPITAPVPKSQVLGKVRDFLGIMSENNKRLELNAKDNSEKYDMEVLTGNESEVIELDLMLGIADLNTPEAVAAAEAAVAGGQPLSSLGASSSDSESEESSDDDEDSENDDDEKSSDSDNNVNDKKARSPPKLKRSGSSDEASGTVGKQKSRKRPKIVEIS